MTTPTSPTNRLTGRLQAQFAMLTVTFLLGMAVNLIGLPDEVNGGTKIFDGLLLGLHVLVAVGLAVNAGLIIRLATNPPASRRFARAGAGAIGTAILSGILTVAAPWSNLWSYLMAVAFLAAIMTYGRLFSVINAKA